MKTFKRSLSLVLVCVMVFAMVAGSCFSASANSYVIQRQLETKWKNYYYGGANLYNTGCGIFSLVNAVGYLTGNSMSITEVASWAHSINAFNVNGGDGTYRLVLYPKVTKKYGADYGFTLDCNNGQGWWAGSSSSLLKSHLANGGVAVGHVPGHFIALVGYDYSSNMYHVYDSAPTAARGTNTYGDTGLGDCWVTPSHLATGKLKLDWFCLLSATGASAEYLALEELVSETKSLICVDYTNGEVIAVRNAYANAVAVLNNTSSTDNDYKTAYNTLYAAMHPTANILSVGKSYTTSPTERTDAWADDGKRLTDGVKGDPNGGNAYSGWKNNAEIVVDLGSAIASNTYTAYFAGCTWGISTPVDLVDVEVSYSNDKTNYTSLGISDDAVLKNGSGVAGTEDNVDWSTFELTFSTETVNARYIKFNFTHKGGGFIWLDEIEVAKYDEPFLSDKFYVNAFNTRVDAGQCVIFSSGFGEITAEKANHSWTMNVIATKNADGSFTVDEVFEGTGASVKSVTLTDDQIMIAAHAWEGAVDSVPGSVNNNALLKKVKAGDVITFSGVTTALGYYDVLAYGSVAVKECNHSYDSVVTAPTCTEQGYTTHTCTLCGDSYVDTYVSASHTEGEWETLEDGSKELRCSVCGELLDSVAAGEYELGDVTGDGKINMFDYMMIKSISLNKYTPSDAEFVRADINNDGKINMFDYIMVKQVCMS